MEFAIVNGLMISKKEVVPGNFLWNRPFVLAQDIWFGYGSIPLLGENLDDIRIQLDSLNARVPAIFNNRRELFRLLKRMLNKNKFYRSGHIQLQIFVSNQEPLWMAQAVNYDTFEFPHPEAGLLAQISDFRKLSTNPLSALRCHQRNFWIAGSGGNEANTVPRSIFMNEKGIICDVSEANVFIVKKGVLITPGLETGCNIDLLREIVMKQAAELKIPIVETNELDEKKIMAADEIFLAGEARGIEWVMGIGTKRFVRNYSSLIHRKVDDYLKEKVQAHT